MKKIAFVYIWKKPPIRQSVERMLAEAFPEYEVEPVGIGKMLKRRPDIMALNELAVARHYGGDILRGKRTHSEFVVATPYLFREVRRIISSYFNKKAKEYAFTFQLQSLFDASQPGIPHFLYTDRTNLANRAYPGFDPLTLYTPAWIELEKSIYDHTDLIFVRSNYIRKSLLEDYQCPPEKAVCVYAGSNTSAQSVQADKVRYSRKNILFVGVDWQRKGGPDLEQAFRLVLEQCPDATLTIIGGSPKIDLPQVQVLGFIPVTELPAYYAQASVFCLPTKNEAFGVAFIEAMQNHLPIVATNLGAIPDFVTEGENGYLVTPGDIRGLANALISLLENPIKCETFGKKSREIYLERYNWENTGRLIRQNILPCLAATSQINKL